MTLEEAFKSFKRANSLSAKICQLFDEEKATVPEGDLACLYTCALGIVVDGRDPKHYHVILDAMVAFAAQQRLRHMDEGRPNA
jgi:hypothetical protein